MTTNISCLVEDGSIGYSCCKSEALRERERERGDELYGLNFDDSNISCLVGDGSIGYSCHKSEAFSGFERGGKERRRASWTEF